MKKRTTAKELEELESVKEVDESKQDRIKELVDGIENALKQSPVFRIPTMIDREALHTYLQVQYKDHIKANVLTLLVELGELINE